MKTPKFNPGQMVLLHGPFQQTNSRVPFGPKDEVALVIEHEGEGMYMVQIPEHLRFDHKGDLDPMDDGLREISEEFMFSLTKEDTITLNLDEADEALYWHSETPDPGDPAQPNKEALAEKLRKFVKVNR
jgi:hypothetical protein